jgi:hypothetical protein
MYGKNLSRDSKAFSQCHERLISVSELQWRYSTTTFASVKPWLVTVLSKALTESRFLGEAASRIALTRSERRRDGTLKGPNLETQYVESGFHLYVTYCDGIRLGIGSAV